MKILCLDVETTISNKGNPFDQTNKLICIGLLSKNSQGIYYEEDFEAVQEIIDSFDLLVGFNIKFDLHWLRRVGIDFSGKRIWDCQIGEFLLENQLNPYPSLNQAACKYGLGQKEDVIKNEYWDKGIDTNAIPRELLSSYLQQDLKLTEQVYLKQVEQFKTNGKYPLFKLQCMDLLVLQEMEYNGIKFDTEKALSYADELDKELTSIYQEVIGIVGNGPINLNSNDHLSVILYGGSIVDSLRIPIGIYKSGEKAGQPRYKLLKQEFYYPRLVEPLKGTETKEKEGEPTKYWKVNEGILRSLKLTKQSKKLVELIGRYSEIEKLRGTYLKGYSELITKMHWPKDMLHGTLNQCTVVTGRLSSTKPNTQNPDPKTKQFMTSRYL